MKNKKLLMLISLMLSTGLLMSACSKPTEPTPPTTPDTTTPPVTTPAPTPKAPKKLILGTSADYAPYEFVIMENGADKVVGFDIEVAKEIAKDLDAELEIKNIGFDSLLLELNSGKVDFVISGMEATEKRQKEADFSKPYYYADQSIVIRKADEAKFKSLADFKGSSVGAQTGSIQEGLVNDEMSNSTAVSIQLVPDLILSLKSKKVDAVVVDNPVAMGYIAAQKDLMIADIKIGDSGAGNSIAVKKGNTVLVESMNKTIDRLTEDGSIEKFFAAAQELSAKN